MNKNIIHQIKTEGRRLEGMGYVIECDDGSTLILDGGMGYDADILLDYLKKTVFCGSEIVIDAWIFSHSHPDHTFCAKYMAIDHSDEVKVKKFIYNFPCPEDLDRERGAAEQVAGLEEAISVFGAEHIVPRRGDSFTFGGARIDILFTHEDLPAPADNLNDSSTVFRLTADGQTVLFLGDAEFYADDVMIKLYGKELKADILQLAHHGYNNTDAGEVYSYADPSIVFWPVSNNHYSGANYAGKVRDLALNQRFFAPGIVNHVAGDLNMTITDFTAWIPDERWDPTR
jgi:beta-lactamase superfamily II metal-dependent hydrolase